MNRRQVLASIPVGMLAPGCLEALPSLGPTSTPTAVTQKRTEQFTVTVGNVQPHHSTDTARPPVSGTFDCTAKTVSLDGWLSTSSCRTVAIQSVGYDGSANRLTIVLFDKWDASSDPEEITCTGVTYTYKIRVEARDALQAELRIIHRTHWDEPPRRFTVTNDDC